MSRVERHLKWDMRQLMKSNPRILLIATSADEIEATGNPTGLWLEELTTPAYAFGDAGAEVTIASIAGGTIPIDPNSVRPAGQNDASVERYLKDPEMQTALSNTAAMDSVDGNSFDAIYLAGGHGTMFDFPGSTALADLVSTFDREGKIISAVCHGPAGLVSARKPDGSPLVANRRIAGFTNEEERAVGLEKAVPFLLETRLKELGALHESGPANKPFTVSDGNLLTGQNPKSAEPLAKLVLEAMRRREAA